MSETITYTRAAPGGRRRFTLEQKRRLLLAAQAPGASISSVARQYGLQASMLFGWRKAMENGKEKGLESGEDVVPASQLLQAEARIRALERLLGKKTMQVEILEDAVRIAREKNSSRPGSCQRKAVENEPHSRRNRRFSNVSECAAQEGRRATARRRPRASRANPRRPRSEADFRLSTSDRATSSRRSKRESQAYFPFDEPCRTSSRTFRATP